MKITHLFFTALLLASLIVSGNSHALTVKGIDLPEQITQQPHTLFLNGAGIRSKFVFDIYVGALYVTKKSASAQTIINDQSAKQVHMHFVYDEISQEKMTSGWNEGFKNVLSTAELEKLKPQIALFNNAFGKTVAGDVIIVAYTPEKGSEVRINGETRATIPGFEFHQALMKIWLGEDPVDSDLKRGMLGKTDSE